MPKALRKTLVRRQERPFSAHHMLIRAARLALKGGGGAKERGSFHDRLTAMTFSALAIEALCNSIGERVITGWEDFESASPNAKLRILTKELGIDYKRDAEPWAAARDLMKFRNAIAHAKPELIVEEKPITQAEHDAQPFDRPPSKLERQVTRGKAQQAVATAERIKELLCSKVPKEIALGLSVDGWMGQTSAIKSAK